MKIYLLCLSMLLSGCSSIPGDAQKMKLGSEAKEIVDEPSHLVVIAEVCTTISTENNLLQGNTVSREKIFSAGPYTSILTGTTIDNHFIYRGYVARPENLTYFTVNTPTGGKYLFKRNYRKYLLNQWSSWEKPDALVDDKYDINDHPFFWLATRSKDRTNELKKLGYTDQESPKVRFKIMHNNQYYKENFNEYNREKIVLEHKLPQCE